MSPEDHDTELTSLADKNSTTVDIKINSNMHNTHSNGPKHRSKNLNLTWDASANSNNMGSPSQSQSSRYQSRAQSNVLTPMQQLAKHQKLASTSVSIYKPKIHEKKGSVNYSHTASNNPDPLGTIHGAIPSHDLTVISDADDEPPPSQRTAPPLTPSHKGSGHVPQPQSATIPANYLHAAVNGLDTPSQIIYNSSTENIPTTINLSNASPVEPPKHNKPQNMEQIPPISPYSIPSKSASIGSETMHFQILLIKTSIIKYIPTILTGICIVIHNR